MQTAISDDMFSPEVIADPYPYYDRLREEDPVHWNEKVPDVDYQPHRRFDLDDQASRVCFPAPCSETTPRLRIRRSMNRTWASMMILFACIRPTVHPARPPRTPGNAKGGPQLLHSQVHGGVASLHQKRHNPPSGPVQDKGHMDVMRDLATPLPVLGIAEMMGVPPKTGGTSAAGGKTALHRPRRT